MQMPIPMLLHLSLNAHRLERGCQNVPDSSSLSLPENEVLFCCCCHPVQVQSLKTSHARPANETKRPNAPKQTSAYLLSTMNAVLHTPFRYAI